MTIKDIAALANVSISTVSKVINNKAEHIPNQTREKILAIIEENNYVPYQKAIEKMASQVASIGLLNPDISDIFCAELAKGVEDYFFSKNYSVIICNTYEDYQKEQKYIEMLKKKQARGIIRYLLPNISPESIDNLKADEISCVILDNYTQAPNVLKTYFNNRKGGFIATKHLITHGHQRIGYISEAIKAPYLSERYEGYKQALTESQIGFTEGLSYISREHDHKKNGYDGAKYLMSQEVTAIFCSNDRTAVGVYEAIAETGREIPRDISIVGFDDSIICGLLTPNLTSIRQSAYDIGYCGASLLYNKINGFDLIEKDAQIEPQLVSRDSVAVLDKNKRRKKRVVVIGEIRMDIFLQLSSPKEDGIQIIGSKTRQIGGQAVKRALELRALGAEVYLVGRLGNDTHGRNIYEYLLKNEIKTDGLIFDEELPTGIAYITYGADGDQGKAIMTGANSMLDMEQINNSQRVFKKVEYCCVDSGLPKELTEQIEKIFGSEKIEIIQETYDG